MTSLASSIREQEISKTRKVFPLRDFRGVKPEHITRLEAIGIGNIDQMLAAGKTSAARHSLADETGIPLNAILELVKLADISRLGAIKSVRARLYYDAGLDTPEKFAGWDPKELQAMLVEFVRRTEFDGIALLPKEVQNAVAAARSLPKMVEYE